MATTFSNRCKWLLWGWMIFHAPWAQAETDAGTERVSAAFTILRQGMESGRTDLLLGGVRALQLLFPTTRDGKVFHPFPGDPDLRPMGTADLIADARFFARRDPSLIARIDRIDMAGPASLEILPISLAPGSESEIHVSPDSFPNLIGAVSFEGGPLTFQVRAKESDLQCPIRKDRRHLSCSLKFAPTDHGDLIVYLRNQSDKVQNVWLYAN